MSNGELYIAGNDHKGEFIANKDHPGDDMPEYIFFPYRHCMLNFNFLKQHIAFYLAQLPLRVIKFPPFSFSDSLVLKLKTMKTQRAKRLSKRINTICDFNTPYPKNHYGETDPPTGTDPTNTTVTSITTISTPIVLKG
jgi:hypothetical protein